MIDDPSPTWELCGRLKLLHTIQRADLDYAEISGKQIIGALLRECAFDGGAEGFFYNVLQEVANEARRRCLLINPNIYERTTYSSAVGNTSRMLPSQTGWEQTKGILTRHLREARNMVRTILQERFKNKCSQSSNKRSTS
jgi:hypothetical protein